MTGQFMRRRNYEENKNENENDANMYDFALSTRTCIWALYVFKSDIHDVLYNYGIVNLMPCCHPSSEYIITKNNRRKKLRMP